MVLIRYCIAKANAMCMHYIYYYLKKRWSETKITKMPNIVIGHGWCGMGICNAILGKAYLNDAHIHSYIDFAQKLTSPTANMEFIVYLYVGSMKEKKINICNTLYVQHIYTHTRGI